MEGHTKTELKTGFSTENTERKPEEGSEAQQKAKRIIVEPKGTLSRHGDEVAARVPQPMTRHLYVDALLKNCTGTVWIIRTHNGHFLSQFEIFVRVLVYLSRLTTNMSSPLCCVGAIGSP